MPKTSTASANNVPCPLCEEELEEELKDDHAGRGYVPHQARPNRALMLSPQKQAMKSPEERTYFLEKRYCPFERGERDP